MSDQLVSSTIIALISGILTYLGTRFKTKGTIRAKEMDADSHVESVYVQNITTVLTEYKEQVSTLRNELSDLKYEFAQFKQQHYQEQREFKTMIDDKDDRINSLVGENEGLKKENTQLKVENAELKEEKDES